MDQYKFPSDIHRTVHRDIFL